MNVSQEIMELQKEKAHNQGMSLYIKYSLQKLLGLPMYQLLPSNMLSPIPFLFHLHDFLHEMF